MLPVGSVFSNRKAVLMLGYGGLKHDPPGPISRPVQRGFGNINAYKVVNVHELESRNFLRVHRQYVVNLSHVKRLVKGEGIYLVLTDGSSVPISRQQKDRFMEHFGWV